MNRIFGTLIVITLVAFGLASTARAGFMIIKPTAATAGPTTYAGSGTELINGDGLAAAVPTGMGVNSMADLPKHNELVFNMWEANGTNTGWVVFNLGSIKTVDRIIVWNAGEEAHADTSPFNLSGRSAKLVTIYSDNSPINPLVADGANLVQSTTFSQATNASLPSTNVYDPNPGLGWNLDYNLVPVEYLLPTSVTAQYFEINIASSWSGGGYVGLSEVRFGIVPEPASVGALAIAGGLMVVRRRHRVA